MCCQKFQRNTRTSGWETIKTTPFSIHCVSLAPRTPRDLIVCSGAPCRLNRRWEILWTNHIILSRQQKWCKEGVGAFVSVRTMWVGVMLQTSQLTQLWQKEAVKMCPFPPRLPVPELPQDEMQLWTEFCTGLCKGPFPGFGERGWKTSLKITKTCKLTKTERDLLKS